MTDYDRLLPKNSTNRPEVHEIVRELRAVHDEFGENVMIGEAILSVEKLME